MNRLKRFLTDTVDALLHVAGRYPVETALSLYAFALFILTHERIVDDLPEAVVGIMPITLYAALATGALTRRAAPRLRLVYYAVTLLPALSWAMGEAWFQTSQYVITASILAPLALLMARRTVQNRRFVGEALAYVEAGVIGGIFALVTLLAFLAIFHSVVYIFGIWGSVVNDVRSYASSFAVLTLWPLLALSMLDRFLDGEPQGTKTSDALLNYILAPALLVYAAILYLYGLQILFAWTLPIGGVAYLVFGFTIALFAIRALQVFVVRRRYDWFFDRVSYFALPPLVLFWAGVAQRVADYGLTDWRVYLIICGAIMTVSVGLFLARRTARYYYIAGTAFVCFLTTAYIPYFSASALSLRSQTARAERLARETGLLDAAGRLDLARIDERDTTLIEGYRELYSSLDYLDDNDTLLLADRFGISRSAEFIDAFQNTALGHHIRWGDYDAVLTEVIDAPLHFLDNERRDPLDIAGYRHCYAPASVSYDNGRARYTTSGDTLRLYLPDGCEILRRSFAELLHDRAAQQQTTLDDEALYTADNLLVYRTDSLLVSFRRVEASRHEHRYTDLDVDIFFTK
ncbi:hypothetical protein [Alistipes sp.]|uniref:hypothetical protein n=1 Tax=Alistipes sp. TaxID=1872444 RepID=UPI003A86839D